MTPEFFTMAFVVLLGGIVVGYTLVTQHLHQKRPTRLITGGHCGLCGKWLPDAIVDAQWPWSICEDWETECFNTRSSGESMDEET